MSSEPTTPILSPSSPVPSPQPSVVEKIFIGKDGLRAGWSLLIFIALVAIFFVGLRFAAHALFPQAPKEMMPGEVSLKTTIVQELIPFVLILLATWIMSKIEGRRLGVYGLGGKRRVANFLTGLAWGFVFLSLLVLTLWKAGLLGIDQRLLSGAAIFRYGAGWLLAFLAVGLLEEYLTRGYIQYTLGRGVAGFCRWAFKMRNSEAVGFWAAAAVWSFLFGFGHGKNPGESPVGMLSAGLIGIIFCLSLWRTGSVWWAVGFHAAWDWAQSFLYGVADSGLMVQHHLLATHPVGKAILSGGTTGPEGSIFILVILSLITFIIFLTLPRTRLSAEQECSVELSLR